MKVLLIKDVKSLGKAGEIKDVKEGYGRNFLIAKGFAYHATDEVIKKWEIEQEEIAQKNREEIERLKQIEKRVSKVELKLHKKLGANGSLYGSITKDEIANQLKKDYDIDIDKKSIQIDKNGIKKVGNYEVSIKLGHGIYAKLNVEVIGD